MRKEVMGRPPVNMTLTHEDPDENSPAKILRSQNMYYYMGKFKRSTYDLQVYLGISFVRARDLEDGRIVPTEQEFQKIQEWFKIDDPKSLSKDRKVRSMRLRKNRIPSI